MQTMHKKHMCPWLLPGLLGLARCAPVPHTYAAIIEAGFYPEGTDLQLVLKIIETARQEIRLMDYSFTSWEVVVRTFSEYKILHVKVIVSDDRHTEVDASESLIGHVAIYTLTYKPA